MRWMKSFNKKDLLSLSLSAVALVVSMVTMYFTFFRHVDDIQVRVAEFDIENTSNPAKDRIVTTLAFINRGNQPALITGTQSIVGSDREELIRGSFEWGGPTWSPQGTFPFVLDKGQMKLIVVYDSRRVLEANTPEGEHRGFYGLEIASIDSQSQERGSRIVFGQVDVKDKRITSFKGDHVATSVFDTVKIEFRVPEP